MNGLCKSGHVNWDDLRYFLALARAGTLSGAAKQLTVKHTTVSRRIHALEDAASSRLFDQHPRGFTLTSAGQDVLQYAETMEEQMQELSRTVLGRDTRLSGALRNTTFDTMLERHMDVIAEFSARYPHVELEFTCSYGLHSLTKRDADIALRMTTKPPEHLVGRRLSRWDFAPYAGRALFENTGQSRDLSDYRWIVPAKHLGARGTEAFIRKHAPNRPGELVLDHTGAMHAAVLQGMGVAVLPCRTCDDHPDMVQVMEPLPSMATDLWLLTHPDLRNTARVRAFTEHVARALYIPDAAS